MAEYCTTLQVANFLGITTDFSASTNPLKTAVTEWIEANEDTIDKKTMHAWRTKTITDELHHMDSLPYGLREGVKIFLEHRKIKTFESGTDKLEVWDGTQWLDYVANKVEGRNNDFWVDYKSGLISIRNLTTFKFFSARVTYRYGETSVDRDIRKACILMTAADVLNTDDRSVSLPEGTEGFPIPDKSRKWIAQAKGIISDNREVKVMGV